MEEAPTVANNNNSNKDPWIVSGGAAILEAPMRSGAIALVSVDWLYNFAHGTKEKRQMLPGNRAILPRRQDLPPEAFISLDEMIEIVRGDGEERLPIVMLSYMWLHPLHPDPKGVTLWQVARMCKYISRFYFFKGIFWDYASLYQPSRTEEQDRLFRQGLDAIAPLFASNSVLCFKITGHPPDYGDIPDHYP